MLHTRPMEYFKDNLSNKLRNSIGKPVISSRLKRMESILNKLDREPNMDLSRMTDIAGVRIILSNINDLTLYLKNSNLKNLFRKDGFIFQSKKNYIDEPKLDGYRSIHLYYINNKYNCNLELQIRTKLQHEWATIVEILGSIMKVPLKSGQGDQKYKLFLNLCSALYCYEENTSLPKNLEEFSLNEIYKKLKELHKELNIIEKLKSIVILKNYENKKSYYYVLLLDLAENKSKVFNFDKTRSHKAYETYLYFERKYKMNPEKDVVLVSANSIKSLEIAYPNYFFDTQSFIQRLESVLEK